MWLRDEHQFGVDAACLAIPCCADLSEWHPLDVKLDSPCGCVLDQSQECCVQHVSGNLEVREAKNVDSLPANQPRGNNGLRAGRLTELHEPRAWRRSAECGDEGLAPERIDHERWTLTPAGLCKRFGQRLRSVSAKRVDLDGGVRSVRSRARKPLRSSASGHYATGAKEFRRLDGNESQSACRSKDEYRLAFLHRSTPRKRQPRGQARNPE